MRLTRGQNWTETQTLDPVWVYVCICERKFVTQSQQYIQMSCLSSPTFSSVSSPVNNLPFSGLCSPVGSVPDLGFLQFFLYKLHPSLRKEKIISGLGQLLPPAGCQWYLSILFNPAPLQPLFACFCCVSAEDKMVQSDFLCRGQGCFFKYSFDSCGLGHRHRVLSYHGFPLCTCNCQNIASGFLCQKKSSFAREGQEMNFSTNSFSWRLYHSVFLFSCLKW